MPEIKSILLPFNNCQPTPIALDAAHRVSARFESYIEGAYYRQLMPIIAGEGITLPGGLTYSGQAILDSANEEISTLHEEMDSKHGALLGMITG